MDRLQNLAQVLFPSSLWKLEKYSDQTSTIELLRITQVGTQVQVYVSRLQLGRGALSVTLGPLSRSKALTHDLAMGEKKKKWPGIKLRTTEQNEAPPPGSGGPGPQLTVPGPRFRTGSPRGLGPLLASLPARRSHAPQRRPRTSPGTLTFVFQSPARHSSGDG